MIYVIANLHGHLRAWQTVLQQLHFNEEDTMFLLGDFIDYGDESIPLLKDIMQRNNVFPIMGEHEYTAVRMLSTLRRCEREKKTPGPNFQRAFGSWVKKGGMKTVSDFRALSADDAEAILSYLSDECVPYEEIEVGGKNYLLVHAGISDYAEDKPLDEYELKAFISSSEYPQSIKGYTLVSGHTPTDTLDTHADGKILVSPSHIAIDCNAARGGSVACLCLDTLDVIYV